MRPNVCYLGLTPRQTYDWDAENRLIKITYADNSSTWFIYDGLSRRVRITERNPVSAITSDKRYLWAGGNQPAEERDAAGSTVLKQFHPQGEFIPAATAPLNKLFYTKDHLGSVRELVDAGGALQTRYDYDMWGKRIKLSGTTDSEVGYTGHHHHAKSGLTLTWYRAYDSESGRWLSADPIGERGGINLYGYVGNDPLNAIDPFGLWTLDLYLAEVFGVGIHIGYNGGQLQLGLTGGLGAGISGSFDVADSGCRDPNKFLVAEGNLSAGAFAGDIGVNTKIAGNAGLDNFDTSNSWSTRVGANFYGKTYTQNGNYSDWEVTDNAGFGFPGLSSGRPLKLGVSGYAGGGIQLTFGKDCESK